MRQRGHEMPSSHVALLDLARVSVFFAVPPSLDAGSLPQMSCRVRAFDYTIIG
jgi:hypothetical protein